MSDSNLPALSLLSNQLADAVDAAARYVVQVHGRRRPASGVVVREGLVLTTARALGREDGLRVRRPDGQALDAELAGWDPTTGMVLLRVAGLDLPPAAVAVGALRVGYLAVAIARSWSNNVTATAGMVAVIGGPLPTGPGRAIDRVIRITAPMHSGFAGGALIDGAGQLAGITTASEIRGLAVVIPADIALASAAALTERGSLRRGYLGIAGQPIRLPAHQRAPDDRTHALLIAGVSADSPAERGGILVGDIVLDFDGHPVQSPVDLLPLLEGDRVGRTVNVMLLRGGTAHALSLTIGEHPPR
jgi:serine protease Do